MEKIELRKVRDFGQLFNDSILFLNKNFRSFFGILLFLAGPFIILTGLFSGYLQSVQSKIVASPLFSDYFGSIAGMVTANFFGTFGIFFLIYLLTSLVTIACINLYFKSYDRSLPGELPLTKNIISPFLAVATWRLFYNILLFAVILFAGGAVFVALMSVLLKIPVFNVFVGIALFIASVIFLPILFYLVTAANFIIIRDEVLITEALRKATRYMRGNFWWTWLLMVAVGIMLTAVSTLFNLPLLVLSMTKLLTRNTAADVASDNSMMYIIFGAISLIGRLLVITPVFATFCVFNFFSQEERHEGTGLISRIEELDTK